MSPIADDPAAELRTLRARAYGPDADIDDDPEAMRRLRELEHAPPTTGRAATPPERAAAPDPWDTVDASSERPLDATATGASPLPDRAVMDAGAPETPAPDAAPGGGDAASPHDALPPASWWRRRSTLFWLTALLVTAVVATGATLWAVEQNGRVAVLNESADGEWPRDLVGNPRESSRLFEEYLGLVVVVMPRSWDDSGEETDCLYVFRSDGEPFTATMGCAAGAFSPTAGLSVTERAPDELLERFPVGSALHFVLVGDRVNVYASAP